jgi:hypothetical protein
VTGSRAASADWLHRIRPLTETHTILVIAGPKARDVWSLRRRRPTGSQRGSRVSCGALLLHRGSSGHVRSISRRTAWEIHVPLENAVEVRLLIDAGAAFGIVPFGLYATESMRIEKGYRHWKSDLINEFDPFESGLDRFIDLNKSASGALLDHVVRMSALPSRSGRPPSDHSAHRGTARHAWPSLGATSTSCLIFTATVHRRQTPHARRDQRLDTRPVVRLPVHPLLAHGGGDCPRRSADSRSHERKRLPDRHPAHHRRQHRNTLLMMNSTAMRQRVPKRRERRRRCRSPGLR